MSGILRKAILVLILSLVSPLLAVVPAASARTSCSSGCVTTFDVPAGSAPFGITRGPRNSEWVALNTSIIRIAADGQISTYPIADANPGVGWLYRDVAGIWFAERLVGKVGFISADGQVRRTYPLSSPDAIPHGIVRIGWHLYITEYGTGVIDRLNIISGAVHTFPLPTANSGPLGLTLGGDGNLWFTERTAGQIARMTPSGQVTEWPLGAGSFPNRIALAPDGAVWFTDLGRNEIDRITPAGQLRHYPMAGGPVGLTVGKDGQLYTALYTANALGRVNLQGTLTGQWALPGGALQVAPGQGLDIWVADTFNNHVFKVTPY